MAAAAAAASIKLLKSVSRESPDIVKLPSRDTPYSSASPAFNDLDVKRLSIVPTKWYNNEMIELPKPRVTSNLFTEKILTEISRDIVRTGSYSILVTGLTYSHQNRIGEDFAKKGKCWIVEFDPTQPFTRIAHKTTIKEAQDASIDTLIFVIKDCEKLLASLFTTSDTPDTTSNCASGSGENSWRKLFDDLLSGYDAINIIIIASTCKSYAELRSKYSFIGDDTIFKKYIQFESSG